MKFAGIDWATDVHYAALVGDDGKVLSEWKFPHSQVGLVDFVDRLTKAGGPSEVLVAVESGAPLVVDQLLAAGFTVYDINPKQADRFRDRISVSGAKDDRRDALSLALALRTDRANLRPFQRSSDLAEEIQIRDRARTRRIEDRTRLCNQLRQALSRYFPAALELEREMHDAFFLGLLEAARDPEAARGLRVPRLQRLLKAHRIRALTAEDLVKRLHAPSLAIPRYVVEACRDEVSDLVAQIRLLNKILDEREEKLGELCETHPDHELIRSLPGLGEHLEARMLAELGDRRERHPDSSSLRAYAGTAPITRRSGKQTKGCVTMRRACNRVLQCAFFQIARGSLARCPWARAYVDFCRGQGMRGAAIYRSLSNKWAKIAWAVLNTRTPYDEAKFVKRLLEEQVPWATSLRVETAA